jgi:hypothetical protein
VGGESEVIPCCGRPGEAINSCPFPALAVVVGEDFVIDQAGEFGTIVLGACSLHVRHVVDYVEAVCLGDMTLLPVEDRQVAIDALEASGHQVLVAA